MGKNFLNALSLEFKNYNLQKLSKDLMAGVTVAAVALPLALAFGVSAGATAAAGLITAIIAGIVMSMFTGGYYQISGPTGAMAAILGSLVATYGMQGVFIAGLMSGIILVIAGVLHLGELTSFVPSPVIIGFTSGIAVVIALGQIDNFFGTHSEGASAIAKLLSYKDLGFKPDLTTVLVAMLVVVLMIIFPKKWNSIVPASLIGIIITTALTIGLKLDIATVGEIPQSLFLEDRLSFSKLNLADMSALIAPAFSIAILNMLESLLCGASAGRATGIKLNNDQELFAQGVGNIILPFFGGIPATAALARTSVAVKSGAVTRLTGIFHAVGLLIMMFILAPVIKYVPLAGLAGVLMVTAWRMNEWEAIKYIFSHKFKGAISKFIVTMIFTILFDLTVAIIVGVGLSLILMLVRLSKLQINYERVDMDRLGCDDENLKKRYNNAMVAYITGPLLFANISVLEELPQKIANCDTVMLSMRGVSSIDVSAVQTLLSILTELKSKGIDVTICGLPSASMHMLYRSGITDLLGEKAFYWSVERALLDNRPYAKC